MMKKAMKIWIRKAKGIYQYPRSNANNIKVSSSTRSEYNFDSTDKSNFDVFASAQRGAKFVLMDFHLTEPIRTARKTINKTIESLGRIDKDKRRIINAINNSFEETVENLVKNSYIEIQSF
jgi:hypothetical protein